MAFEVRMDAAMGKPTLAPMWMSREMHAPEPPTVANGVVYVLLSGKPPTNPGGNKSSRRPRPQRCSVCPRCGNRTGIVSSNKLIASFTHFNEPVVAGGQVYVCTWDGKVYSD